MSEDAIEQPLENIVTDSVSNETKNDDGQAVKSNDKPVARLYLHKRLMKWIHLDTIFTNFPPLRSAPYNQLRRKKGLNPRFISDMHLDEGDGWEHAGSLFVPAPRDYKWEDLYHRGLLWKTSDMDEPILTCEASIDINYIRDTNSAERPKRTGYVVDIGIPGKTNTVYQIQERELDFLEGYAGLIINPLLHIGKSIPWIKNKIMDPKSFELGKMFVIHGDFGLDLDRLLLDEDLVNGMLWDGGARYHLRDDDNQVYALFSKSALLRTASGGIWQNFDISIYDERLMTPEFYQFCALVGDICINDPKERNHKKLVRTYEFENATRQSLHQFHS